MLKYTRGFFIILFTLLLALGGLFLPVFLMNKQQESLFAKTEAIHLPTAENTDHKDFIRFAPDQLLPIAFSYGEGGHWNVYDSVNEDLTTEYLIQTTHEQIDQLCQLGILPEIFSGANYTWENIERGNAWTEEIVELFPSVALEEQDFSGWIAYCRNSNLFINVRINASSGQILNLSASWTEESKTRNTPQNAPEILAGYLNYLELNDLPHSIVGETDTCCSCRFENDYPVWLIVQQNNYAVDDKMLKIGGEFYYETEIYFLP